MDHSAQRPQPQRDPLWAGLVIPAAWVVELAIGMLTATIATLLFDSPLGTLDSPVALLIGGALGSMATLALVWSIAAWWCGVPFRQRLALGAVPKLATALGVLVGALGFALATVVTHYFSTGESMMSQLVETPLGLLCVSLIAVLFAPLTEEIYYRGFLLPFLGEAAHRLGQELAPQAPRLRTLAWGLAALMVTLWFGAIHIPQLLGDPLVIPVIFVMSAVWTGMRWYTGSLWPSLASHLTYNSLLIGLAWLTFENW